MFSLNDKCRKAKLKFVKLEGSSNCLNFQKSALRTLSVYLKYLMTLRWNFIQA